MIEHDRGDTLAIAEIKVAVSQFLSMIVLNMAIVSSKSSTPEPRRPSMASEEPLPLGADLAASFQANKEQVSLEPRVTSEESVKPDDHLRPQQRGH